MKLGVFLICSGVGYLLGHYLPDPWSTYASILISYHLFLFCLVITADHDAGFALPVVSNDCCPRACLAVLIGLAIGRRYVPFLGIVRMFVPALAPFECNWLFSKGATKKSTRRRKSPVHARLQLRLPDSGEHQLVAAAPAPPKAEYTCGRPHGVADAILPNRDGNFERPAVSVGDEMKLWLAARERGKAAASAKPESQLRSWKSRVDSRANCSRVARHHHGNLNGDHGAAAGVAGHIKVRLRCHRERRVVPEHSSCRSRRRRGAEQTRDDCPCPRRRRPPQSKRGRLRAGCAE